MTISKEQALKCYLDTQRCNKRYGDAPTMEDQITNTASTKLVHPPAA